MSDSIPGCRSWYCGACCGCACAIVLSHPKRPLWGCFICRTPPSCQLLGRREASCSNRATRSEYKEADLLSTRHKRQLFGVHSSLDSNRFDEHLRYSSVSHVPSRDHSRVISRPSWLRSATCWRSGSSRRSRCVERHTRPRPSGVRSYVCGSALTFSTTRKRRSAWLRT
jgi:hypothetical protein